MKKKEFLEAIEAISKFNPGNENFKLKLPKNHNIDKFVIKNDNFDINKIKGFILKKENLNEKK